MRFLNKKILLKAGVVFVVYSLLGLLLEHSIPDALVFGLLLTGIDEFLDSLTYTEDWEEYFQSLDEKEDKEEEKENGTN